MHKLILHKTGSNNKYKVIQYLGNKSYLVCTHNIFRSHSSNQEAKNISTWKKIPYCNYNDQLNNHKYEKEYNSIIRNKSSLILHYAQYRGNAQ